jgi:hypothetical protein
VFHNYEMLFWAWRPIAFCNMILILFYNALAVCLFVPLMCVFLSRITCLSSEKYWTKFEQFLEWLSVNNKLVLLYNKYTNWLINSSIIATRFCLAIIPKFLIIYSNYFAVRRNNLKFWKLVFRWFLGKLDSEMRVIWHINSM